MAQASSSSRNRATQGMSTSAPHGSSPSSGEGGAAGPNSMPDADFDYSMKHEFDQYLFPRSGNFSDSIRLGAYNRLPQGSMTPDSSQSSAMNDPSGAGGRAQGRSFDLATWNSGQLTQEQKTEMLDETVGILSRAHNMYHEDVFDAKEKMKDRLEKRESAVVTKREYGEDGTPADFDDPVNETKDRIWLELTSAMPNQAQKFVEFCKSMPGFNLLSPDDRHIILKTGLFDVWLITQCCLLHEGESFILLQGGSRYTRRWMNMFLSRPMVDEIFIFAEQLNRCQLLESEIAILQAIALASPERPNLKHRSEVQSLHNHFLDAFAQEVAKNHPSNSGRILIDVFRILPHLRYLNSLSQQTLEGKKGSSTSSSSSSATTPAAAGTDGGVGGGAPAPRGGGAGAGEGAGEAVGASSSSSRGLNMVPPSPSGSDSSGVGLPTHASGTAGAT